MVKLWLVIPLFLNMGLSENVGYIPNEIAIKKRDNDQQNHWVFRGLHNIFRHTHIQSGAPLIAKLVYNYNNYGLWYL